MCGIFGSINHEIDQDFLQNYLPKVMKLQNHRGPDSEGTYVDPLRGILMGHNRLSIVDLTETGLQPMKSSCGNYVLVYNGEIYNAPYLKNKYLKNVNLSGRSDTEILLELLARFSLEEFINKIDGMFAFAIYSSIDNSVKLVRDRSGQKPLFYYHDSRKLIFASEVQTLVAGFQLNRVIDRNALSSYLKYGFVVGSNSIWNNIKKIPAGNVLTFSAITAEIFQKSFLDISIFKGKTRKSTPSRVLDNIDELLDITVQEHLTADVPVGIFLSGGVDSSLLSYYASKKTDNLKAFTVAFENQEYNEALNAQKVAKELKLEHHIYKFGPQEIPNLLTNKISKFNEPLSDPSMLPTLALSVFAREHVKVVLTGDGADELFFGYSRHVYFKRYWNTIRMIPLPLRYLFASTMHKVPLRYRNKFLSLFLASNLQITDKALRMLKIIRSESLSKAYEKSLEVKSSEDFLNSEVSSLRILNANEAYPDIVNYLRKMDFTHYLEADILTKTDRMTMLASLEGRAPFLSNRIIEFAQGLSHKWLSRGNHGKYLLRILLNNKIHNYPIERDKMGFSLPIDEWLRVELKTWAEERIFSDEILRLKLVNEEVLRNDWQRHIEGSANYSHQVMLICILAEWLVYWKPCSIGSE